MRSSDRFRFFSSGNPLCTPVSRGDNEPERLASYSGSARSKLDSSELDSGSCSARDLNKPSRANPSSARKAREQARNNHIHIIHE
ncbi:hypothetical protein GQ457_09G007240 [Hibiscus cannabinus]